jgi:hypothetical protein
MSELTRRQPTILTPNSLNSYNGCRQGITPVPQLYSCTNEAYPRAYETLTCLTTSHTYMQRKFASGVV